MGARVASQRLAGRALEASAPARANLVGNPSDLYGGAVIGCSVPRRARARVEPAAQLALEAGGERLIVAERGDLRLRGDRFDVGRAALAALPELPRARVVFETEIPFGSGLGGSTALLVALLRGLLAFAGELPGPYLLAERARQVERELLGVACGFVDHYLCTFGGFRAVDFRGKERERPLGEAPFATLEDLEPHARAPFVVAFTGISRHSGAVHAPLRERWERGDPELRAAYARVAGIAREGKAALLRGEWERLGALMNENHAIQRDLGGSGDANERLIAAALEAGAPGAKLAGAGRGGSIAALWPEGDPAPLEAALRRAGAAELYRTEPVPGVTLQPID